MDVRNVHERRLDAPPEVVGALLDRLASDDDPIWPGDRWPPMRFDRPLGVGADGGHGPVRYEVVAHEPGRRVAFRFKGPAGFQGTHRFEVEPVPGGAILRHVVELRLVGRARVTWPLIFRPLHDAVLEDALDRVALATGTPCPPRAWSPAVRLLRAALDSGRRTRRLLRAQRRGGRPPPRP